MRPRAKITPQHEIFIAEYLSNGMNGTAAAIAAGYSPASAKSTASEMLADPVIKDHLDKVKLDMLIKYDVKKEDLINEYLEMIIYAKQNRKDKPELKIDANLWLKATDSLAKLLGLNEPKKLDITNTNTPITIMYNKPLDEDETGRDN